MPATRKKLATEKVATSGAFLVYWARDRVARLTERERGKPLEVFYGSPHSSAPPRRRYGVGPGASIYIVYLRDGVLFLVARAVVADVVSVETYLKDHLELSASMLEMHLWALQEELWKTRPELGHRLPFGCVDEAALLTRSSPLSVGAAVPVKVTAALRFVTKKGEERALPLVDGKLKKLSAIQGHFHRLTPASGEGLERLLV